MNFWQSMIVKLEDVKRNNFQLSVAWALLKKIKFP